MNSSAITFDGINKYIRITDINDKTNKFMYENITSPDTDLNTAENYRLKYGDILFARTGASVGKTYIYDINDGTVYFAGFLLRARIIKSHSPEFIFQQTLTNKYRDFVKIMSQRSGQPGINANEYKKFNIYIPKLKEQKKVSSLLLEIDKIIELHQRRINILEELKKAYLKEMLVDQVNKLPNLRFKGFKEEWQLYKLGDLGSTFTGLQGKSKVDFGHGSGYYVPYTNIFNNLFVDTNQLEKIEIDSKQNSLKYGDVLFTTSSETPVEVGMSSIWLGRMTNVYLNSFCFGYRLNTPIDLYFLAFFLRSPYFRKKMSILAQGISRYNISKTKVMDSLISVPENTEQKYIGKFLVGLEKAIEFQNSKIKKIKELKKEYLNKMFI